MNNFKPTTKKEQIIHNGTEETKQKCIPYIIDNRYLKRERLLLLPSAFIFIVTLRKVLCLSIFKMYVIKNQMDDFNRCRHKFIEIIIYI